MNRIGRLMSPGVVFVFVGALALWIGPARWLDFHGGYTTTGALALAIQLTASGLAIHLVSEGGPQGRIGQTRFTRGPGGMEEISARFTSFGRALVEFYRYPLPPILLLSFGLGASSSAISVGLTKRSVFSELEWPMYALLQTSEVPLVTVLLIGCLIYWVAGSPWSYSGWVLGFGSASALGEIWFESYTSAADTLSGWGLFMAALVAARLLVVAVDRAADAARRIIDRRNRPEAPV
jgi:hypothetical protein